MVTYIGFKAYKAAYRFDPCRARQEKAPEGSDRKTYPLDAFLCGLPDKALKGCLEIRTLLNMH